MNRTLRTIIAVVFIAVITFSAIAIFQNIGKSMRADITDQKLYTLSDGTKAILAKIHQPVTVKLYYTRTAAMKAPDQIRFYNNYYYFVKALLDEYAAAAKGMINLQVIDPRPYSDEETEAIRYGVKKLPISEDENFFFGLVLQTQFGVTKTIPFFSPDRQNFVEYDISYLIDSAMTRAKKRVGILSSLPVMGDDVTGYMAQMMAMQGQQPKPAWGFVDQLREKYDVSKVAADAAEIKDIDILLIIHPKNLGEKTLFAIDQFVLRGGRTIVCEDPHCVSDRPSRQEMQYMQAPPTSNSDLNRLTAAWGLEMPANTFAGDRSLALTATLSQDRNPEKVIAFLELNRNCVNNSSIICSNLNQIRVLFAGALMPINDPNIKNQLTPLIQTTAKGNTFSVANAYELMMPDPGAMMAKFIEGSKPVVMGYMVTGKFKSAFPNGIEVPLDPNKPEDAALAKAEPNKPAVTKKTIKGVAQASTECTIVVFSDVDFISDILAFQRSFFGQAVVGDNAALMMNAVDDLGGSDELIAIRSRGNFQRPFVVVDKIESEAEKATADQEAKINAEIQGFQQELNKIVSSAKEGQEELVGQSIVKKKKEIEDNIRLAQVKLREVKAKKRVKIEELGTSLRTFNMTVAPAAILIVAIVLGIYRGSRRRHYISHASDS